MNGNKFNEVQDKVFGTVKETAGKLTDNNALQLRGTLQKGFGKAREITGDVTNEIEDVKDKVVGTVKETTGKLTNNRGLQLKGKIQRSKATSNYTYKIIIGVGFIAFIYFLSRLLAKKEQE